ncbi:hypothetical protein [Neptunicella marina]|uniref:Uncharacterized protein n=1 Tax=Neptunicella marina TaxID=2125989 RepID=A0A8J6IUL3_9ALTE|nr:hypothetical protein [Neptunicella marina]MBC3766504.1 hypothetical protein [Neptunicella marina]
MANYENFMFPLLPRHFSGMNACVGNNGTSDLTTYANGYESAAEYLLGLALKSREAHADELIHPISFNIRHSIELRLKGWLDCICKFAELRGRDVDSMRTATHNLSELWQIFEQLSTSLDDRYSELVEVLKPYICGLADMDNTGETFRYPKTLNREQHLSSVSIINLNLLAIRFIELKKITKIISNFNDSLLREYEGNTHTKELSWAQIKWLSEQVSDCYLSNPTEIKSAIENVTANLDISNREYGRAMAIIKEDFLLSANVGPQKTLKFLTKKSLDYFLNEYKKYEGAEFHFSDQEITTEDYLEYLGSDEDRARRYSQAQCIKAISATLKVEEIIELTTLYYFADNLSFSKGYEESLEIGLRSRDFLSNEPEELEECLYHLLSKTPLIRRVTSSLIYLNQFELVDVVLASELMAKSDISDLNSMVSAQKESWWSPILEKIEMFKSQQFKLPQSDNKS